jgi:hypothetical protein
MIKSYSCCQQRCVIYLAYVYYLEKDESVKILFTFQLVNKQAGTEYDGLLRMDLP